MVLFIIINCKICHSSFFIAAVGMNMTSYWLIPPIAWYLEEDV